MMKRVRSTDMLIDSRQSYGLASDRNIRAGKVGVQIRPHNGKVYRVGQSSGAVDLPRKYHPIIIEDFS
jgi:hypothetical protein